MENEILEAIKESLRNDGFERAEEVTIDSNFEELGIDSITGLLIINDLEEKYDTQIDNEIAFNVSSIKEAISLFKESQK